VRDPTNDEQRLMIIGGFDTLQEYLEWMNSPTDPAEIAKLDEPDWEAEFQEEDEEYQMEGKDFMEVEEEDEGLD